MARWQRYRCVWDTFVEVGDYVRDPFVGAGEEDGLVERN